MTTREITDDRLAILIHVIPKLNLQKDDKVRLNNDYLNLQRRIWAFGLAKGKSFKSITLDDSHRQMMGLVNDSDHLYKLGKMAAVDIFLGNDDRLTTKNRANIGNWMTDDTGDITAIDNFDTATHRSLNRGHTALQARNQALAQGNEPTEWDPANTTYQEQMDKLAPWRIHATGLSMMKGLLRTTLTELEIVNRERKKAGQDDNPFPYQKDDIEPMAKRLAPHLTSGLKAGRDELVRKLAPSVGKRSRTIKNEVTGRAGGLGMAGWKDIKKRAKYMRNLKTRKTKPGKWMPN